MCIDFEGHHSGGSSFVYVSDILILLLKKTGKESQYMVSHPELSSDPLIGSDWESGCDTLALDSTSDPPPLFLWNHQVFVLFQNP